MSDNNYETKCNVVPIEKLENGQRFHVSLELPMSYGWYDDVCMVVEKVDDFPLKYTRSEGNMAIFETTIDLETRAIYSYHFTCLVNGYLKNIKNGTTLMRKIWLKEKA